MASERELSINVVTKQQAKGCWLFSGLSQNGNAAGMGAVVSPIMGKSRSHGNAAGEQREPKPILSVERNMVSP
jgi:hypothetical protein